MTKTIELPRNVCNALDALDFTAEQVNKNPLCLALNICKSNDNVANWVLDKPENQLKLLEGIINGYELESKNTQNSEQLYFIKFKDTSFFNFRGHTMFTMEEIVAGFPAFKELAIPVETVPKKRWSDENEDIIYHPDKKDAKAFSPGEWSAMREHSKALYEYYNETLHLSTLPTSKRLILNSIVVFEIILFSIMTITLIPILIFGRVLEPDYLSDKYRKHLRKSGYILNNIEGLELLSDSLESKFGKENWVAHDYVSVPFDMSPERASYLAQHHEVDFEKIGISKGLRTQMLSYYGLPLQYWCGQVDVQFGGTDAKYEFRINRTHPNPVYVKTLSTKELVKFKNLTPRFEGKDPYVKDGVNGLILNGNIVGYLNDTVSYSIVPVK